MGVARGLVLWGHGRCFWLLILGHPSPVVLVSWAAPFVLTAQRLDPGGAFPERKAGDRKAGGQAWQQTGTVGDRACGLVQKGLAVPLQHVHTVRRFPVAGCLRCSVCSVCLCNAGGQNVCHCLCSGRVGTQCVCVCSVPVWSGRNGKEQCVCSERREQCLLAQGVGLPSDCAAEGRCCACRCSVLGLCSAAAQRGGTGLLCGVCTAGWAVSLCPCNTGLGSAPLPAKGTCRWQCPACSAGAMNLGAPASLRCWMGWMGGGLISRSARLAVLLYWQCRKGSAALYMLWQCPVPLQ